MEDNKVMDVCAFHDQLPAIMRFAPPSIDVENPFYCPDQPPALYIKSLQSQVRHKTKTKTQSRYDRLLVSFVKVLENAVLQDTFDSSDDDTCFPTVRGDPVTRSISLASSSSSSSDETNLLSNIPRWEREHGANSWRQQSVSLKKRKRGSFSDIRGPTKYAKSILSAHDSSFDVTVKRETLEYSTISGSSDRTDPSVLPVVHDDASMLALRLRDLQERYFGPSIGTESTRDILAFIDVLDGILPGIRLKERLLRLPIISHQSIIDFLGVNELSLRDTPIHDFDLVHIHHLPRLATLLLDNTTISNEAIFLLVPLKRSLTQLSIGSNPAINDDAASAIQLLSKLTFLSILDTGFLMPGIRRIAQTIADENRIINVEVPSACTEYIRGECEFLLSYFLFSDLVLWVELDSQYEIDLRPPLIVFPEVCKQLSAAALQRNLLAHKQKNHAILATGSKAEMAERLKSILEARRMDLLVRDMIFGTQDRTRE
ncbi:hypothetical protein H0H92_003705 [Tricholoma furcatifolium]|nr:hypothetical protein H0H92_003705 [Tricholoma furcatifolium]